MWHIRGTRKITQQGMAVNPASGRAGVLFRAGWISLLLSALATLVFGLIVVAIPAGREVPYFRARGGGVDWDGPVRGSDYNQWLQAS